MIGAAAIPNPGTTRFKDSAAAPAAKPNPAAITEPPTSPTTSPVD